MGPNYLKEIDKNEKAPTLAPNHVSFFDIPLITTHTNGKLSWVAAEHVEKIPFFGYSVLAGGGLFARRGGSIEVRQACVD